MKFIQIKTCLIACFIALLAACGGGGSTGTGTGTGTVGSNGSGPIANSSNFRAPLTTVVQDIDPIASKRPEISADNFYPLKAGNTWVYKRVVNGTPSSNSITVTVSSSNATQAVLVSSIYGSPAIEANYYRITPKGIYESRSLPFAPLATQTLIGDLLKWPTTFYAEGAVSKSIRQGLWDEDLDGDGLTESFRLETSFTLVGTESFTLPRGTTDTVHIKITNTLTISPSDLQYSPYSITYVEDSWWASNIGLVRSDTLTSDTDGFRETETLNIESGTIDGTVLFQPPSLDGTMIKLALPHNDVVFDANLNRYYASIPSTSASNGNSIAIIDPKTGGVTFSRPVGSEPFALALAPDGSAIYVGLEGTGEIVKMRLPDLQEVGRTLLPYLSFYGQVRAQSIAVSSIDPDVLAVSTQALGVSPSHTGVVLIRNGVVQPKATQSHTGSNIIAFDPSGNYLYGYNNETTEFGLRKIQVLADGVSEVSVIRTNGNFSLRSIDVSSSGVVVGSQIFNLTDLGLTGDVNRLGTQCRSYSTGNRLACFSQETTFGVGRIALIDMTTFAIVSKPLFATNNFNPAGVRLLTGGAQQIALSINGFYSSYSELWLFTSPALP
jgi:hypothetical protein